MTQRWGTHHKSQRGILGWQLTAFAESLVDTLSKVSLSLQWGENKWYMWQRSKAAMSDTPSDTWAQTLVSVKVNLAAILMMLSQTTAGPWNTSLRASLVSQMVKNLPAMWKSQVLSLGQEDPLEKRMATCSSVLARSTPWTKEPGGLPSMELQRVRQDWAIDTLVLEELPSFSQKVGSGHLTPGFHALLLYWD